jgi:hypothetical protein
VALREHKFLLVYLHSPKHQVRVSRTRLLTHRLGG